MRKFLLFLFLFVLSLNCGEKKNYSEYITKQDKVFFVDIENFCNWSYLNEENNIGWIVGSGPWYDLNGIPNYKKSKKFPEGKTSFKGVPFYIIPHTNKKCVICVGYAYPYPFFKFPLKAGPIPVNKKAKYLFFLHSSAWVRVLNGGEIGKYKIVYKHGSEEIIEIKRGYQIQDWWNVDEDTKILDGEVAWTNDIKIRKIGICMYMWKNPYPGKEIKEIVIEGNKKAQLFLFAITGVID